MPLCWFSQHPRTGGQGSEKCRYQRCTSPYLCSSMYCIFLLNSQLISFSCTILFCCSKGATWNSTWKKQPLEMQLWRPWSRWTRWLGMHHQLLHHSPSRIVAPAPGYMLGWLKSMMMPHSSTLLKEQLPSFSTVWMLHWRKGDAQMRTIMPIYWLLLSVSYCIIVHAHYRQVVDRIGPSGPALNIIASLVYLFAFSCPSPSFLEVSHWQLQSFD